MAWIRPLLALALLLPFLPPAPDAQAALKTGVDASYRGSGARLTLEGREARLDFSRARPAARAALRRGGSADVLLFCSADILHAEPLFPARLGVEAKSVARVRLPLTTLTLTLTLPADLSEQADGCGFYFSELGEDPQIYGEVGFKPGVQRALYQRSVSLRRHESFARNTAVRAAAAARAYHAQRGSFSGLRERGDRFPEDPELRVRRVRSLHELRRIPPPSLRPAGIVYLISSLSSPSSLAVAVPSTGVSGRVYVVRVGRSLASSRKQTYSRNGKLTGGW